MTSRRAFLLGAGAALAAPAVVRAESLMKLWVPKHEIIVSAATNVSDVYRMHGWECEQTKEVMVQLWQFGAVFWRKDAVGEPMLLSSDEVVQHLASIFSPTPYFRPSINRQVPHRVAVIPDR